MLSLDKLSIKGFKSFVEPTDFEIKNGLTGIVGPNGCGKSNIVEAIRFGLGEVSAKQLRGKEIDDLIFNGTDNRPSWNIPPEEFLARGMTKLFRLSWDR